MNQSQNIFSLFTRLKKSMANPKPIAKRVKKHADKRREAGQVRVFVRDWVLPEDKEAAKEAMKEAVRPFVQPNPD